MPRGPDGESGELVTVLDWRGDWEIASVPVLILIRDNPYTHWSTWERTRESVDTARWLLAVRSHRWVTEPAMDTYLDEATWWRVWTGVLALRWALSRRYGPPGGFLPSTELALRPRFGVDHLYRADSKLLTELFELLEGIV